MPPTLSELRAAAAQVHAHVSPTPQYPWPLLAERIGCSVWIKHENHTPTGAFKIRGGVVYMAGLKRRQPECRGVIAATRGNHGQSIAVAASRFDLPATIVVPEGNNPEKNRAMAAQGARLVVHGDDFQAALEHAQERAVADDLHMVPSFHPDLVMGVASYALELFDNVADLDVVYVPIGLGSGICGVIHARDALGLRCAVVGVQAEGAPCYALSFERGQPVSTNRCDTFADGVATRVPVPDAVGVINRGAARVVLVSDDQILRAQGILLQDTHNLAEPAGAAPLAAALAEQDQLRGKRAAAILTGGNADQANIHAIVGSTSE